MIQQRTLTLFAFALFLGVPANAQITSPQPSSTQIQTAAYPSGWDVQVKEKTKLEAIKQVYERRPIRMLASDIEDRSPLPAWFRAYLRDNLPAIPIAGKYQYPRVAQEILEWMLAHPNLEAAPPTSGRFPSKGKQFAKNVKVGGNINLTNLDERNSESFIAQDYNHPKFLIAASNNLKQSGRQRQFFSTDGGVTWGKTELPFPSGIAIHSDPALAFSSDGTAWATTLGIDSFGTQILVQVFKSIDHGATWSFVSTASTGKNNDKELMWIDTYPTSPFKDFIYLAWDVPGRGMRFTRSTNGGLSWDPETVLSTDPAIGSHLATGPLGEVYVAWPVIDAREIRIAKSTDGGATFQATKVIGKTNSSYEMSIPAMCQRNALLYLSIGVDRSNGPRKGTVYAAWTDLDGSGSDPGCAGSSSGLHSRVFISASTDGGNTWSSPRIIQVDPATPFAGDQFNQWMDVDPENGNIHVAFYDTRDDLARRKTNIYYIASTDGAATWGDETKVTSEQTDETASGADGGNQYGDYNGIVAFRDIAFPSWTDRRASNSITKEQIFTSAVGRSKSADTDNVGGGSNFKSSTSRFSQAVNLSAYPKEWEVAVPQATKLDLLIKRLNAQAAALPPRDVEDRTPLPVWFRVYLRNRFPNLPKSGRYQYPRTAKRILQQLLDNPNSVPEP